MTATITKAQAITCTSIPQGGGTFHLDGRLATTGTAVTVEVLDKVDDLTDEVIEDALAEVERRVHGNAEGAYLGTWFDEENGVWEISATAVTDRVTAMAFATAMGERYVYDLDADECVAVS